MNISQFKPMLLPNEKTGIAPDWEERIPMPCEWLYSSKKDGGRLELYHDGKVKGRSLKTIPSVHIQRMAEDIAFTIAMQTDCIIECEFYSHDMNFAEIMHFFRTEDVTSDKTMKKYMREWEVTKGGTVGIYKKVEYPIDAITPEMNKDGATIWSFPGRDVPWATTWHDSLKFHAFSFIDFSGEQYNKSFMNRSIKLAAIVSNYHKEIGELSPDLVLIRQNSFEHIDNLFQAYDQSIIDGYEGIVVTHKETQYKTGRYTLKSNSVFKIKDDGHEWDAQIIDIVEGTVAREGAEKTINELGRSKTSQLKEDRVSSGMAKGLLVKMDDGQTLTVSLNGYNHEDRIVLLTDDTMIGLWIRFKGMPPVKKGGVPRHAMFTKGNIRDSK